MEDTVSEETQDSIKAGLVRTQMQDTVSEGTQDSMETHPADTATAEALASTPNTTTKLIRSQLEERADTISRELRRGKSHRLPLTPLSMLADFSNSAQPSYKLEAPISWSVHEDTACTTQTGDAVQMNVLLA